MLIEPEIPQGFIRSKEQMRLDFGGEGPFERKMLNLVETVSEIGDLSHGALQPGTGVFRIPSFAGAASAAIPTPVDRVYIEDTGYYFDRAPEGEPLYGLKFQNNGWWRVDEGPRSIDVFKYIPKRWHAAIYMGMVPTDGSVDFSDYLDAIAYDAATTRADVFFPGIGPYPHSRPIEWVRHTPTAADAAAPFFNFNDSTPFRVWSSAHAKFWAIALMSEQFLIRYSTDDVVARGAFRAKIDSIWFEGNGLAEANIRNDYAFATEVTNCRGRGATYGIWWKGWGGAYLHHNAFACHRCIWFDDRGGDSIIIHNDLYPLMVGGVRGSGIRFSYFGGDTTVLQNVFTGTGVVGEECYGLVLEGGANMSENLRSLVIENNEFAGMLAGVKATGTAINVNNVCDIVVAKNHLTAHGAVHTGTMLDGENLEGWIVTNNHGNSIVHTSTTGEFSILKNCKAMSFDNNKTVNYGGSVHNWDGVTDSFVSDDIRNWGKVTNTVAAIELSGNTYRNKFRNRYRQENASWAQICIRENGGSPSANEAIDEFISGTVTNAYVKGSFSTLRRTYLAADFPAGNTHNVGDVCEFTAPTAGGFRGKVITTAGTPGTSKTFGAITA